MRRALFLLIAAPALAPASAHAAAPPGTAAAQPGVVTKAYKLGPIPIGPGQNDPRIEPLSLKPDVPGWIVGFRPNLELRGGEIPLVDDIHLHHAVWLVNGRLTFPTGEEKTQIHSPAGYGWRHETGDGWALAHMIHNLTPTPTEVWITWEIDFIPDSSPAAAGMR